MGSIEGVSIRWSDYYTGPSLNKTKRNVPQSNITLPNKSNVVTVTVNLYEEKKNICGEAPVLLPVLPTRRHISARITAYGLVLLKKKK